MEVRVVRSYLLGDKKRYLGEFEHIKKASITSVIEAFYFLR